MGTGKKNLYAEDAGLFFKIVLVMYRRQVTILRNNTTLLILQNMFRQTTVFISYWTQIYKV